FQRGQFSRLGDAASAHGQAVARRGCRGGGLLSGLTRCRHDHRHKSQAGWRMDSPMSDHTPLPEEGASVATRARRQPRDQRRAQILRESIAFFSEHGFSGSTHDLARQIGVTQPLLFRYFDSKEDLFEAIFKAVFTDQWREEWPALIRDRSIPLRERLARFYRSYLAVIFNRDWMRLYIHAGLADVPINRRFFQLIETRILLPLC